MGCVLMLRGAFWDATGTSETGNWSKWKSEKVIVSVWAVVGRRSRTLATNFTKDTNKALVPFVSFVAENRTFRSITVAVPPIGLRTEAACSVGA